jgi:hypothetical protein
MIHSDIFLEIGSQHSVCEDYIIHGYDPFQYIILSDGCSSSNNTEMGSRILCHLAKQFLKYYRGEMPIDAERMGQWIIHNAEMTARQLGLTINCLDATLIISYLYEDTNTFHTIMYGDGCLAIIEKESITLLSISYSNNAPYYLSYQIDDFRRELYEENIPVKKISRIDVSGTNIYDSYDSIFPLKHYERSTPIDENFQGLLVASDGLESFVDNSEPIQKLMPPISIVSKLTSFKNTKGEFVKRRAKKQMKEYRGQKIDHFDDLSVGVFLKD